MVVAVPLPGHEIASFLMKCKEADRIKSVPVQISVIWILTYISVSTTWPTLLLAQRFNHYLFQWHTLGGKMNLGLECRFVCFTRRCSMF